jgi:hypothetical protein
MNEAPFQFSFNKVKDVLGIEKDNVGNVKKILYSLFFHTKHIYLAIHGITKIKNRIVIPIN